jgi:glycosyltransferase involved in cell wall biosynthesis
MVTISVVIPTYNRLDRLKRVLKGFEDQTYSDDDFEVVVVSDGSTDGTNEFLDSYQSIPLFVSTVQENGGPAAARNNGLKLASGKYILFVDDDVIPERDLVSEHIRYHQLHDNSVVIGPMLSPEDFDMPPWVSWEQSMLMKQYDAMEQGLWAPTARQFYTGNASLLRSQLVEAGGFDVSYQRAEDVELAYRLDDMGMNFVFNPAAVGLHYAERSFDSWLNIPYAYGCNDVDFSLNKGQDWLLPTIFKEYKQRNFFIRMIVSLCLDRKFLSALVQGLLKNFAAMGHFLGSESLFRMAYSGIFNLRYYQGVADNLGGRQCFYREISLS